MGRAAVAFDQQRRRRPGVTKIVGFLHDFKMLDRLPTNEILFFFIDASKRVYKDAEPSGEFA